MELPLEHFILFLLLLFYPLLLLHLLLELPYIRSLILLLLLLEKLIIPHKRIRNGFLLPPPRRNGSVNGKTNIRIGIILTLNPISLGNNRLSNNLLPIASNFIMITAIRKQSLMLLILHLHLLYLPLIDKVILPLVRIGRRQILLHRRWGWGIFWFLELLLMIRRSTVLLILLIRLIEVGRIDGRIHEFIDDLVS